MEAPTHPAHSASPVTAHAAVARAASSSIWLHDAAVPCVPQLHRCTAHLLYTWSARAVATSSSSSAQSMSVTRTVLRMQARHASFCSASTCLCTRRTALRRVGAGEQVGTGYAHAGRPCGERVYGRAREDRWGQQVGMWVHAHVKHLYHGYHGCNHKEDPPTRQLRNVICIVLLAQDVQRRSDRLLIGITAGHRVEAQSAAHSISTCSSS